MPVLDPANIGDEVAEFLRQQEAARNYWICVWATDLAYTYGSQWRASVSSRSPSSPHVVRVAQMLDPDRKDIRVALNQVIDNVIKGYSQLAAPSLAPRISPVGMFSPEDRDASEVARDVHTHMVTKGSGLRRYKAASLGRVVLGDYFLKAVVRLRGKTDVTDPYTGEPVLDERGKPLTMKDRDIVWQPIFPGEVTIDFSNPETDLQDHDVVIHSQVRPTAWVERVYGIQLQTETTVGQLMATHEMVHQLSAGAVGGSAHQFGDSRSPGCVLHEVYLQDEKRPGEWPHWFLLADPVKDGTRHRHLTQIARSDSAFRGLPFLHLQMHAVPGRFYGIGQPRLQISRQDILNHLWSQILRYTGTVCNMPWVADKATLLPKSIQEMKSNRWNRVIQVDTASHQNAKLPQIVSPPELPQSLPQLADEMKRSMREAAGLSDVAFGRVSARGESADAIRERADLSETVMSQIVENDEQRLPQFLLLNIDAAARLLLPERLDEITNQQFSPEQLEHFRQANVIARLAIQIEPGSLLPRTPREKREENQRALDIGIADPAAIRFKEWLDLGAVYDPVEAAAWESEWQECQQMLATGQPAETTARELHPARMLVITHFLNQRNVQFRYPPDRRQLLVEHYFAHVEMAGQEKLMELELMPPELMAPPEEETQERETAAA